jgi:hypothetical protein
MRINYYRFPETVDAQTRYQNGADPIGERGCTANPDGDCPGCPHHAGNWYDCPHATVADADDTVAGVTITHAKALLREFGGAAWTHHCERDGGVFETTEIRLAGNNSRHKYNRHL